MIDKIEVYIKNEKVIVGQRVTEPISDGVMKHMCFSKKILDTEKVMPEAEKLALDVVNEFASEKGLNVAVYDVSTFKGKLKARLKGIKTTPTIIIGKVKIEGEHTSELLKSKLGALF
jgi:hypothetical protein